MSYTALYRKYRPNNFANVVGQNVIVEILKNSIKNNNVSHAYLFTGPRGTGKTSVAKIFARAVNCQNFTDDICETCQNCTLLKENDTDIIEIDAASNNGVEEIRLLRDNVKLLPSFCKYKVYIIDEVHMLSTGAFNALLKTLEEPPAHVIFILATTEPAKIPVTILSRCQRFDFNYINNDVLTNRLLHILKSENKLIDENIIAYISKMSNGGLRDAINLLDQTLSLNNPNVTIEDIDNLSGNISEKIIFDIYDYLFNNDYKSLLEIIKNIADKGKNINELVNKMLILIRNVVINKEVKNYFEKDYSNKLNKYNLTNDQAVDITKILNELLKELKNTSNQIIVLEIYLIYISQVINNKNKNKEKESHLNSSYEHTISNDELNEKNKDKEETKEIVNNEEDKKEQELKKENINIAELKKIRINNVLYGANKETLNKVLKNYDKVNDYLSSKTHNLIAALLIEGKIVAASNEYLLFSFKDETSIFTFDSNYKNIELFINDIYSSEFKVVAVTDDEWKKIKENFIENKKNKIPYVLIDENDVKLEMSDNLNKLEDSALKIFGENAVSVK